MSETVTAVTGKNITIKKTSDDSIITTIDAANAQITGSGTSTITINPTADLGSSTEYYVLIDSGAFKDASNNDCTGISSTTALSFTTADTTAPTLTSSTPADDATGISQGANIVLTMSENVSAVTGMYITIKQTSDNSVIATIEATDTQISIAANVITINPTITLGSNTEYYVLVDSGAFKDSANNSYAGISSTTALSFTTGVNPNVSLVDIGAGTGGFAINGEAAGDSSGISVSSAGDINGDGLADLIVGANGNSSSAGRSYVIFGGTQWLTTSVSGTGSVTGTASSETLIGSSSSDTLTGGGGIDRFYSGDSSDVILLTSSDITKLADNSTGSPKSVINGGGDTDAIRLTAGANLDLTAIANQGTSGVEENSRIESIERIDLFTDGAANTLTLTVNDVIDMSGMNLFNTGNGWTNGSYTLGASVAKHQLVIDGTAADSLVINAGNGV